MNLGIQWQFVRINSERVHFIKCPFEKTLNEKFLRLSWRESPGLREEELFGVERRDRGGVSAAYVIGENFEGWFGERFGVFREEKRAAFLGGISALASWFDADEAFVGEFAFIRESAFDKGGGKSMWGEVMLCDAKRLLILVFADEAGEDMRFGTCSREFECEVSGAVVQEENKLLIFFETIDVFSIRCNIVENHYPISNY